MRNEEIRLRPALDFRGIGSLEKQAQGFCQIGARLLQCASLACNVEFRAKRNVNVPSPLNQCGQPAQHGHTPILQPIANREALGSMPASLRMTR